MNSIEDLLQKCREHGLALRTAESCTAGAVAVRLTGVSGASDVFDRAWVTYSNQAKMDELAVPENTLLEYGAVSEEVVKAMAQGGSSVSSMCIAISGIAGPSGGTKDKPVGTVWMAVSKQQDNICTRKFIFSGDRQAIQLQAVDAAIGLLFQSIESMAKGED